MDKVNEKSIYNAIANAKQKSKDVQSTSFPVFTVYGSAVEM